MVAVLGDRTDATAAVTAVIARLASAGAGIQRAWWAMDWECD